jgi:hypothetical protein
MRDVVVAVKITAFIARQRSKQLSSIAFLKNLTKFHGHLSHIAVAGARVGREYPNPVVKSE